MDSEREEDLLLRELRQVNANLVSVIGIMQSIAAMIEMTLDDQQAEDPQNPRTL